MDKLQIYFIVGVLTVLLVVVVMSWLSTRASRANRAILPEDSLSASPVPHGLVSPSAPFAEQIEEMVRAELATQPELAPYSVDFGTAPDGGLEISVNGKTYLEIKSIPEEPIRNAIARAIASYSEEA